MSLLIKLNMNIMNITLKDVDKLNDCLSWFIQKSIFLFSHNKSVLYAYSGYQESTIKPIFLSAGHKLDSKIYHI